MSTETLDPTADKDDARGWATDQADGLARGALLGRYTVLEAIGSGGMGSVFAAWDPELRRRVAIKVLHGDLMLSNSKHRAQERLRREAQAAARLTHPNVVTVFDVGTVDGRLFIAMELVTGQTLKEWTSTPQDWRRTLEVYRQAGRGLAAAHRAGLVHRDFKPSNVMLADDGLAKIMDFGLAKALDVDRPEGDSRGTQDAEQHEEPSPSSLRMTRTGQILGTPRFMSPEQKLGQKVDSRSDQFSFCVSLYESLNGHPPFAADHGAQPSVDRLGEEIRAPAPHTEVPAAIHRVLERGLKADPQERYDSLEELLEDLEVDRPGRWRRRVGAAVLIGLAGSAFWGLSPESVDCEKSGSFLETAWSDVRKQSLKKVFDRAGAPGSWDALVPVLDAKVERMRSMYVETCQATHVRGEQSSELLDRRMACLDERSRAVEAQIRLFETGTAETLVKAANGVGGLPNVAACADREALLDLTPPPPQDEMLATVNGIREPIAEALVLELAGSYEEARPLLAAALAEAEDARYEPLIGEIKLQQARAVGRLGDSGGMKELLIDSVAVALATSHRDLLARAYLQLIVVSFLRSEVDDAKIFGRMAKATIRTLSGRQDLEAERLFFLGMISIREGRFEDAVEQYQSYLTIHGELTPLQRITALNNLAEAQRELGELDEALGVLLEAEDLLDQLAEGHDARAGIFCGQAEIYTAQGDYRAAEENVLACLSILENKFGLEHPHYGNHLALLGQLQLARGQIDESITTLQRVSELHATKPGYEARPAARHFLLGQALWRQGKDRVTALEMIRKAASGETPGETSTVAAAAAWLLEQEAHNRVE